MDIEEVVVELDGTHIRFPDVDTFAKWLAGIMNRSEDALQKQS